MLADCSFKVSARPSKFAVDVRIVIFVEYTHSLFCENLHKNEIFREIDFAC